MAKRRKHARSLPVRVVARDDATLALEVGGVVQSVVPPASAHIGEIAGYWPAMLPARCPRRALLLGLGGGTVARLLAARCPDAEILGIERDKAVLDIARGELWLDNVVGLTVVLADAFAWVAEASTHEGGRFDLVCLDLFEGGRLSLGTLATPFLRQVALLLSERGTLAVNLMVTGRLGEQLHRLGRVYALDRCDRLGGNLVAHLHPLPQTAEEALAPS